MAEKMGSTGFPSLTLQNVCGKSGSCLINLLIFDGNPVSHYFDVNLGENLFKFNNRNIRKSFEICSKLTIKTPE